MDVIVEQEKQPLESDFSVWQLFFIFVVLSLSVGVLFWLYLNIQASMQVTATNADITLPKELAVQIDVNNGIQAYAQGEVQTRIHVNNKIPLPLKGRHLADLKFKVVTPIQVHVDYQTNIPIQTQMPLQADTSLIYQNKFLPKLPLNIDVPIQLNVPFHLNRTYDLPIEINFTAPVALVLNEEIDVEINHVFTPKLNMNDAIEMNNISSFNAVMENVDQQTKADFQMNIDLPLSSIQH